MVKERIVSFLRLKGPSLPVEINKETGYDTFLTLALLGELVHDGLVRKSKRPIGSSLIYYLPDQENKMRERLSTDLNIPERKVLEHIKEVGKITSDELTPHERAFIDRLKDFIRIENFGASYVVYHYSYNGPRLIPKPDQVIPKPEPIIPKVEVPKIEPVKPVIIEASKPPEEAPRELSFFTNNNQEVKKEVPKTEVSVFEKKARKYLDEIGDITNSVKVKTNAEYNYDLRIKKPFNQELLVKAKNKKSINETDLSMLYAEALQAKKPAILLTNGKLTSKAKQWKDANAGELIKIIEL